MYDFVINIHSVFPDLLARGRMYLDPGSGSFLLQILIAGVAGASIFVASYWRKIRSFFARTFGKKQNIENAKHPKDE